MKAMDLNVGKKKYPDSFRKRDFRSKVISLSDSARGSVVTAGVL